MSKNKDTSSMGLAPLHIIKENLDRLFGEKTWWHWELETISLELNMVFDSLTQDKLSLLQVLCIDPELFYHDMSFFLHAVDVMNNKVADFERLPMPTSLELAYAITEAKNLKLPDTVLKDPSNDVADTVTYLLYEEGYSEPVPPFDFIPASKFARGQTQSDTEAKKKAIEIYIREMGNY